MKPYQPDSVDDRLDESSSSSFSTASDPGENNADPRETDQRTTDPRNLAAFSAELLPTPLRSALTEKGYETLTAVQAAVVRAETGDKDLRISSQTGSGKTVAVGLALGRLLLESGPRRAGEHARADGARLPQVLLLTPTRELATQVKRELAWLFAGIEDASVEVVTGGTSVGLERKNLARGPRVIVATPGRALDHLRNGGFSGAGVTCVVLDEADQMFDMGFRDELTAILDELPARTRTHLVSATFSGEVLRIAQKYQSQAQRIEGTALGAANEDIEHVAHVVSLRHRYDALVNLLLKQYAQGEPEDENRALVFVRTRADALETAERLGRDGLKAEPLSGDLAQAQRTRTLAAFRTGRIPVIVATDVAARGIDVQGVDLVIHLDPPQDPDAFTHRSGRTGRAGRKGTSVVLLPPQARARMERLFRAARVEPAWAPVPSADKIKKLYSKLARRKLYTALEQSPDEESLAYAQKLLSEHPADRVIAQLLSFIEVAPVCPPREISEHFAAESRNHERKKREFAERSGPRERFRKGPRLGETRGPSGPSGGLHRSGPSPKKAGGPRPLAKKTKRFR